MDLYFDAMYAQMFPDRVGKIVLGGIFQPFL